MSYTCQFAFVTGLLNFQQPPYEGWSSSACPLSCPRMLQMLKCPLTKVRLIPPLCSDLNPFMIIELKRGRKRPPASFLRAGGR